MNYLLNLLVALDQSVNALFGGYPDETISLHAARDCEAGKRWGCWLCDLLGRIVPNHCANTIANKRMSIFVRDL